MATANALIDETLDLFYQDYRPGINVLTSSVNASDTTFTFTYALGGIAHGAMLGIDLELVAVMGDPTSQSATVVRGQRGSTAASHDAGAVVTVNPRLSRFAVFRALNEELHALHAAGLYKMTQVELTYNPAVQGYDLTGVTSIADIYQVSYAPNDASENWITIPPSQFRLVRNAETDDFASGFAIILYHGGNPGRQLRVVYKTGFTAFADVNATTTTAGLEDSMVDLLPLGVLLRLGGFREWQRATSPQGDTRRAGEVPMGSAVTATRISAQYRLQRLADEVTLLGQKWPEIYRR